ETTWVPALGAEENKGSEIAETSFVFAGRPVRLIVRRQPVASGDQLSFDDLDGYRFHAIITNIPSFLASAAVVEHHHRLRGGIPEEAIRQLKEDFGLNHAPLQNFYGNWLWWHAAALAYNTARWVRVLALPEEFRTCRGKRLRLAFFNVAAASCATPADSTSASLAPTPTPASSSRPSPGYERCPPSPDRNPLPKPRPPPTGEARPTTRQNRPPVPRHRPGCPSRPPPNCARRPQPPSTDPTQPSRPPARTSLQYQGQNTSTTRPERQLPVREPPARTSLLRVRFRRGLPWISASPSDEGRGGSVPLCPRKGPE